MGCLHRVHVTYTIFQSLVFLEIFLGALSFFVLTVSIGRTAADFKVWRDWIFELLNYKITDLRNPNGAQSDNICSPPLEIS
jgi:hypothetical protein